MAKKVLPGVLASFEHLDAACDAIHALRAKGKAKKEFTVYCSHPNHELEAALAQPVSPVRRVTLIMGLTGTTSAFAMTIWMNRDWPTLVGGKPIVAIPAFIVPGFELTVLLAALSSVAAVMVFSKLWDQQGAAYHPRFTDDRIGIFAAGSPAEFGELEALFQHAGAVEVERVTA